MNSAVATSKRFPNGEQAPLSRKILSVFGSRSIWSYHKVQLAVSALVRDRRAFMDFKESGLCLDIGCGPNMQPQNINLDYIWRPRLDICCDITRGLPFRDNYVAGIFTEHCFEHIGFRETLGILNECRRVMMPDSYIRVIVPDFEIYAKRYAANVAMPYAESDPIEGIYTPAMSVNRIMYGHGHRFIFDFATMKAVLEHAGFSDVAKCKYGQGANPKLLLDTPDREVESLYVEARKPN